MNKGKSNYTFHFNIDAVIVENIVKGWLKANKFKLINKYGEEFYYFNDPILYGRRGFQYKIEGQSISIDAWIFKSFGKSFYRLDPGFSGMISISAYENILQRLFNQISAADKDTNIAGNSFSESSKVGQTDQVTNYSEVFDADNNARKEKFCTIGFVLSIIGLILPFIVSLKFGGLMYLFIFYFAVQGLKTSKRGLAISAIVISIVAIALTILDLVLTFY